MNNHLMEIQEIHKYFGGLAAISGFSLNINEGEIVGLIGPNGAGKTTLLNVIAGIFSPNRGKIFFKGNEITKFPPYRRAKSGIGRIFQHNLLFNSLTVLQNIEVGLIDKSNPKTLGEKALEILEFVSLKEEGDKLAITLPHGKQRLLSLAITLAIQPKLLLLDEPLTGMNAEEVRTMVKMIKVLRKEKGITSIVVEHNLKAVIDLCDRIAVLNFGKKLAEGEPSIVIKDKEVIQAYLGADTDVI